MRLTEVPFDQIKVGDYCISAKGNLGIIREFDPKKDGRCHGYTLIEWQNGKFTENPIFLSDCPWLDAIEWLGSKENCGDIY